MSAQPGTAVVGSTSTEQTGRIAGAEQQQRVLEQAAAAGREDPLRWQIAFRPIVAATDALAWEKARTVLAKLESRRANGEVIDRVRHYGNKTEAVGTQRLGTEMVQVQRIFLLLCPLVNPRKPGASGATSPSQ
jgi:alkanesulfonate monooxygenase SsuD/methylene tetrahydromethanopterin reductase-like flavin-dependent oxidoreductase (luciferase family)